MSEANVREVRCGYAPDGLVVNKHSRSLYVWAAERKVYERDAAAFKAPGESLGFAVLSQSDDRAVAVPAVWRAQEAVGEYESPFVLPGISDDAVKHLRQRRGDHDHDLALLHDVKYIISGGVSERCNLPSKHYN